MENKKSNLEEETLQIFKKFKLKPKHQVGDVAITIGQIEMDKLIGCVCDLYYCNKLNSFQLGPILFEVIEDPEDGYRSSMSHVIIVNTETPVRPGDLLGSVKVIKDDDGSFDGYQLVDTTDNHTWLTFGTDNSDDYYPNFIFYYTAKIGNRNGSSNPLENPF